MTSELVEKHLSGFSELKEDWDGEGACAISPETIENARIILSGISEVDEIYPINNGCIGFERANPDGSYFNGEVGKTNYSCYTELGGVVISSDYRDVK